MKLALATVENVMMDMIGEVDCEFPGAEGKELIDAMRDCLKDVRKIILHSRISAMEMSDLIVIFEKKLCENMGGSLLNRYNMGVMTAIQIVQALDYHSFNMKLNSVY